MIFGFNLPPLGREDFATQCVLAMIDIVHFVSSVMSLEVSCGISTGRSFCGTIGGVHRKVHSQTSKQTNRQAHNQTDKRPIKRTTKQTDSQTNKQGDASARSDRFDAGVRSPGMLLVSYVVADLAAALGCDSVRMVR